MFLHRFKILLSFGACLLISFKNQSCVFSSWNMQIATWFSPAQLGEWWGEKITYLIRKCQDNHMGYSAHTLMELFSQLYWVNHTGGKMFNCGTYLFKLVFLNIFDAFCVHCSYIWLKNSLSTFIKVTNSGSFSYSTYGKKLCFMRFIYLIFIDTIVNFP